MTVSELIKILKSQDQSKEVYVSYDSMVCQYPIDAIIEFFGDGDSSLNPVSGIHFVCDWWDDPEIKRRIIHLDSRA